jgi:hypothetical protein
MNNNMEKSLVQAITENELTEDDINERSRCDDHKNKPKSTLKFNSLE